MEPPATENSVICSVNLRPWSWQKYHWTWPYRVLIYLVSFMLLWSRGEEAEIAKSL